MKINELNNLWCAKNEVANFTILVLAVDREEAMEVALEYFSDSYMNTNPHNITITQFNNVDTHFDCDYVISYVI